MRKNLIFLLFTFFIVLLSLQVIDQVFLKKKGLGKPILYYLSPDISYGLRPSQRFSRDQINFVEINNLGMRSSENWSENTTKEKYKILLFGDSVLYGGTYVDNKDILSHKLCKKLKEIKNKKTICGNFGTNAYGITNITNRVIKESLDIKGDLIIVQLTSGNIGRGKTSISGQPFYSKPIEGFLKGFKEIIFFYYDNLRLKFRYSKDNTLSWEKFDKYYFKDETGKLNQNIENFYNNEIILLLNYLNNLNFNYLIIYWPSKSELEKNKVPIQKKILKNLSENYTDNFLFINNVNKNLINKIYYDDIHLTKFGHEYLAEKIYDKLKKINDE